MTEAIDIAKATLDQAGFQVSRRCSARTSCFDFAARKNGRLIFIKVFPDIRDIYRGDAVGIKTISGCFSCISLFISETNNEETLKDDTVYSRYGVYVVTSKTLADMVLRGMFPLVVAAPGGYYVRIDGKKIRERRHELGSSIGKLAEMVGISRSTLYGYERGMTGASVSSAYRLEKILGVPLVKAIDVFEASTRSLNIGYLFLGHFENVRDRFLQFVLGKLAQCGFKLSPISRAPFDFMAYCSHSELKIIGGVFNGNERHTKERMEEILSLSRIVEAKPLLIGDKEVAAADDVTFIRHEELTKIRNREDLMTLL